MKNSEVQFDNSMREQGRIIIFTCRELSFIHPDKEEYMTVKAPLILSYKKC